jgi:hypothetical protein
MIDISVIVFIVEMPGWYSHLADTLQSGNQYLTAFQKRGKLKHYLFVFHFHLLNCIRIQLFFRVDPEPPLDLSVSEHFGTKFIFTDV